MAGLRGDRLKVRVASPPEKGRANEEVAALLSTMTGCRVTLVRGIRSREKTFEVSGVDAETVREKLHIG